MTHDATPSATDTIHADESNLPAQRTGAGKLLALALLCAFAAAWMALPGTASATTGTWQWTNNYRCGPPTFREQVEVSGGKIVAERWVLWSGLKPIKCLML
jgi:hypothetical protein